MSPNRPLHIADFLHEKNVLCSLEANTRDEALAELLNHLHRHEGGFDREEALAAILIREKAASTVIHPGVALPHARMDGLDRLKLAIGLSAQGVDFGSPENGPVRAIFLILTPKTEPGAYLQFLAALTRTLSALKEVRILAGCTTPAELCGLLKSGGGHLPPFLSALHVMNPQPVTLLESDHLGQALDLLCVHQLMDIPVVDEQGDVRGVVSLEDVLGLSMPEHVRWVEDLTPILQFEPFSDLLRKQQETRLADFMREKYASVAPEVPAIQLARIFLGEGVRLILVLEGRKLVGVVTLSGFIAKLFWA
jgi:PTS system nitrogen regulatory IIA component